ncbi:methyltransferase [Streptomyces sp. NPDC048172]|uniref:methyltransferase n=1 Tax=Streptomyces sp. NPDC048172 TaxID=3365505 RepID=UPI00371DAAD3
MTESGQADDAVRGATTSLIFGFAFSQVCGTLSRLGIPEAFGAREEERDDGVPDDGTRSVDALALATGTHPGALHRLLRAGAALGLLAPHGGGRFALTPLGQAFRDGPGPRALAALYGDPSVWRAYGALEDSVRDGKPAYDLANGVGLYEALASGGPSAARFHAAMSLVTAAQTPVIVGHYDFGRFAHVVDVGGGDGTLLAAVLTAHPRVRGTLLETGAVLREAGATLDAAGVGDRCGTVDGDFLTSVPAGGDAYVLKNILHNFDDAACVRILRNCRDAAHPEGRVVVPTLVLPEDGDVTGSQEDAALMTLSDIEMMVLTPGRERTLAEHVRLFAAAGLALSATVTLPGLPGHAVLEARPAR